MISLISNEEWLDGYVEDVIWVMMFISCYSGMKWLDGYV